MIIKITRSTSRISINGTTFISETIPRLPPTNIPMIPLLFGDSAGVGANVSGKCPARRTLTIRENGWGKPPPLQTCEKLLTSFELGGDQTNLVNARAAHDIDGAGDIHEQYIVVAFDESNFLGALLEDGLHARTETVPSGVFVVDLEVAVLVFKLDVLLLVRRRLRDERV